MSSYVKDTGGDFELIPEGTHVAVCDMVVNMGLQPNLYDPTKPPIKKHYIRWQTEDGDIGNFYTSSLSSKANLRKDLEAWRGRQFSKEELERFDLASILGKPCQLSVIHAPNKSGDARAYIRGVMALHKGASLPDVEVDPFHYDKSDEPGTWDRVPEWLQAIITKGVDETAPPTPEVPPASAQEEFDDDIPF